MRRTIVTPVAFLILIISSSTSNASPEAIAALQKAQNNIKIHFTKCSLIYRIFKSQSEIDSKSSKATKDKWASCVNNLVNEVADTSKVFNKMTTNDKLISIVNVWASGTLDLLKLYINYRNESDSDDKILDGMNTLNNDVYSNLQNASKKESYADKVLKTDKWPDGTPIIPTNPDLEPSGPDK